MRNEAQRIPFGKWLPDLTEFENPGLLMAKNCLPAVNGYRSLKKLTSYGIPLYKRVQGMQSTMLDNGSAFTIAGTADGIFQFNTASWTNLSSGNPYIVDDAGWDFAQFGDIMIATTLQSDPEWLDLDAINTFSGFPGTPMTQTGGAAAYPPQARHVMALRDFVVLGHFSGGNNAEKTVQWSSIGNGLAWPTPGTIEAEATQSDLNVLLNDKGEITGMVGYHEYGVIFQRRAITRMTYIGPPSIFQFDTVVDEIGAVSRGAITDYQGLIFFLSETGFCFFDGSNANPIGQEQIDRFVLDDIDFAKRFSITSGVDPYHKVVVWSYCSKDNPTLRPDKMVFYNYVDQRWSYVCLVENGEWENALSGVQVINRPPWNIDNSDPQFTNVDVPQPHVDDEYWLSSERRMVGFNQHGQIGYFNGDPFHAKLETTELELVPGRRAFVTEIYPYIEWEDDDDCTERDGPVTIKPVGRESLLEKEKYGPTFGLNKQLRIPMRWNHRYQRYIVEIKRSFRYAEGLEINPRSIGRH